MPESEHLAMGNTSLTLTTLMLQLTIQRWHLLKVLFWCFKHCGISVCPELRFTLGLCRIPAAGGAFGFIGSSRWRSDSRQTQAGVGYGRKLGENIAVGVQLDLIQPEVTDLGNGNTFTAEAALLYKPSPELSQEPGIQSL